MTSAQDDLIASKKRHEELTQLQVSHSLRAYQRDWFAQLRENVFATGRPYVLTSPNVPHEIFRALDLPFVVDAWYSGLIAARRQSGHYSAYLTEQGYHGGLERYLSLPLAVALDKDNPDKPWGGLPPAALVVSNFGNRNARELADHWGAPFVAIEQPAYRTLHPNWWEMSRWQWEDLDESYRVDFMVDQLRGLIEQAERVAGKKLDIDRLREIVARVNRQEEYFDEVRTLIKTAPKLPVRLGETMSQVMGIQWHRGTEWGEAQAKAFRDEVKARVDAAQWVCPDEKYRFMYVGAGLWQRLGFFAEFEQSHGVVFVRSNYLSFTADAYIRHGARDPVRALASRYSSISRQMHVPPMSSAWAAWEAREHRVSGAIQLDMGGGLKFISRRLESEGVAVLELPVDPVDDRTWNEDVVRASVIEFIEKRVMQSGEGSMP